MHPPPSPRLAPVDNAHFNHPASQLGSTSTGAAEPALPPPHAEPGQQLTIREKLSASTLLAPVYMLEDLVLDLYDRSTNNDVNGISTTITAVSTAYFIMDTLLISTTKFRPWRAGEEVCRFDAEGNEVTIEEPVGIFEDTIMVDHELVQRFLRCGKCKKDVDITGNRFGECEYHPGKFATYVFLQRRGPARVRRPSLTIIGRCASGNGGWGEAMVLLQEDGSGRSRVLHGWKALSSDDD